MSTHVPKASAPEAGNLVQELLAENRRLKVECERLKLELKEALARSRRSQDPRLSRLEAENRQLREELSQARARLEALEESLRRALVEMERALTRRR